MKKRRIISVLFICLVLCLLLTGCLYPGGGASGGGQTVPGEYLPQVQNAVETYRARSGVLPIKNSEADTPVYEKYKIDFRKLMDHGLISRVPDDAFEGGGVFEYVIIDPEGEMQVKLRDLVAAQQVADLQREIDSFRLREGFLPLGEEAAPSFYQIDYEKIGRKPLQVRSVYSSMFLTAVIHESGRVAIDYAPEIMNALRLSGVEHPDPDIDLRIYLTEQSPFVPTASFPYIWSGGMPVISAGKSE